MGKLLTDRRTIQDAAYCVEFVEMLSERRAVWATVFRKHDLKIIKAHHEEVKKRGEEIEAS